MLGCICEGPGPRRPFNNVTTCHLSTTFCENPLSNFCVVLLTNKQTSASETITSLTEVKIFTILRPPSSHSSSRDMQRDQELHY